MGLVERAKNICLNPKSEWTVIAGETTETGTLITGYVLPLAGISAIAGWIGGSVIGHTLPFVGTYRTPFFTGLTFAVYQLVMAIVGVVVLAVIINALAPSFGGKKNAQQAIKVAAYSYTPAWIAGVLMVLPALGVLALLGALYGLYLIYLGLPRLMSNPEDRSLGYTVVVVICAIVIAAIVGALGARITRPAIFGGPGLGTGRSAVEIDRNSALGKLQELGNRMEEAGKKMEAAQQSGNPQQQLDAAMEGLGTMLAGGRRYDPLSIEQLKAFVPESFTGLPRSRSNAEKSGIGTLMVSKAEATYGNAAGKHVDLEISDTGGAGGLMRLAAWANVHGEKEDDGGIERTRKEGARFVHERISKGGGPNEFAVVLADRFIVTARGQGVTLDELKSGATSLDLRKLEAMKDVGAQK